MGQLLRKEDPERVSHITTKTIKGRLWFVAARAVELRVLGYLAMLREKYGVILFAFAFMGNHYHLEAKFPNWNRASFMRDFNSQFQRYTKAFVAEFGEGPLWARRYDEQILPLADDVEKMCWYCAFQQVAAGLCDNLKDSPHYNSFHDAIHGIVREYEHFREGEYRAAKLRNQNVKKKDFITKHKLKFERLPGYERLSQKEYRDLMLKKYAERRIEVIRERGRPCMTKEQLKRIKPGAIPKHTKKSTRHGYRPIAISVSREARDECVARHFTLALEHKEASKRYRDGDYSVIFPVGTYRPPILSPPPRR